MWCGPEAQVACVFILLGLDLGPEQGWLAPQRVREHGATLLTAKFNTLALYRRELQTKGLCMSWLSKTVT